MRGAKTWGTVAISTPAEDNGLPSHNDERMPTPARSEQVGWEGQEGRTKERTRVNDKKGEGRMNEKLRLDGLSGGRGWARVGVLALSERKGEV